MPSATAPKPSEPRVGRLLHPHRWLRGRDRAGEDGSALAFGIRLLASVVLTLALVGITGYALLERSLAQRQITNYAAALRADARSFERQDTEGPAPASEASTIRGIQRLLDAIAQQPGILAARLIDSRRLVRAAANEAQIGETDTGPDVNATLKHGSSFAGRETSPALDRHDFAFTTPVNLASGRYAFDVSYDHRAFDAQVNEIRTILAVIALIAMIGGGVVFYLVGGRRLMRDHRTVLRRATRDGLTDLPNQRAFHDDFPQAVASAARYEDSFAVALLDIDEFKRINDRRGHQQGDAILKRVAAVLREARPGDRPYRIGGDEFALLLAHTDADGARILSRRLSHDLTDAGIEVSIGASGLRPGVQADTLRAEADAALYEAKRQGGSRDAHFDDIRERVFVTTVEKKEAVRRLIDEGRLTTVFQPIWNFDAQTLLGVEALTRPDPSYGLSGPAEAFDIAEQIGRVHQLDVLCVENALEFAPDLEPGVLLFVNLSPLTLDLDAEADPWLAPVVERAGLRPQAVVVEVTERFGGRTASVVKQLTQLRQQGFRIAVDDVGTGNSGLEILRNIEAEFVKLDRSIVTTAPTEPGARAVLMAMATFARQTGAFVIAEGVEDEDTLQFLRGINERDPSSSAIIQGGQGFGLGRPSPDLSPESPAIFHSSQSRPQVLGAALPTR
ncbi:MAG: EAL domain-containing protein [Solirubrobacterales bacterium]